MSKDDIKPVEKEPEGELSIEDLERVSGGAGALAAAADPGLAVADPDLRVADPDLAVADPDLAVADPSY